ncbi:MAG TPA: hypothetical protein VF796_22825 [Humisphaera sp.]
MSVSLPRTHSRTAAGRTSASNVNTIRFGGTPCHPTWNRWAFVCPSSSRVAGSSMYGA